MDKISIVVPAYNAANTIERCIKSIINQNLKDWELLIVENGSTDATTSIIKKYVDNLHIFLLHSKKGVSYARNLGIEHANGKWIWFVDADDEICFNISSIFPLNDKKINLICGNYIKGKDRVEFMNKNSVLSKSNSYHLKLQMLENPTLYMTVWSKLFNTQIIKKQNIRFDLSLRVAEDSDFLFNYLKYTDKILTIREAIYKYSLSEGSTVRTPNLKNIENYEKAMQKMDKELGQDETMNKAISKYIVAHFFISMVREVFVNEELNVWTKLKIMRKTKDKRIYKNAFNNLRISDITQRPYLLPGLLLKYNFNLLPALAFKLKAKINERKENGN